MVFYPNETPITVSLQAYPDGGRLFAKLVYMSIVYQGDRAAEWIIILHYSSRPD